MKTKIRIPVKLIFKLISTLLAATKGGIDESEREELLAILAEIALSVVQDAVA